jgi:competence CoiA-like predicted nuclease
MDGKSCQMDWKINDTTSRRNDFTRLERLSQKEATCYTMLMYPSSKTHLVEEKYFSICRLPPELHCKIYSYYLITHASIRITDADVISRDSSQHYFLERTALALSSRTYQSQPTSLTLHSLSQPAMPFENFPPYSQETSSIIFVRSKSNTGPSEVKRNTRIGYS